MLKQLLESPYLIPALVIPPLLYFIGGLRQIKQWEIALKFTLGRYSHKLEPGLRFFMPIVQRIMRIDMRTRCRELFQQAVITKDNVTLNIDAVVYYRVVDPEKAILAVEDFDGAVKDRCKVVLRDLVGETSLNEVLAHRDQIALKVAEHVEHVIAQWGLHVEILGFQDIQLPGQMQEVLAKAAIAEREREYVVIKSKADVESARNFAEAARTLIASPGAIELRRFEALQTLTQQGTNKVIFDLTKPFDDVHQKAAAIAVAMSEGSGSPKAAPPAPTTPERH